MKDLLRLDHVGIAVPDLDASAKRLEQMGFERRSDGESGPDDDQGYPGLNARWALYGLGQSEPIVLLEPLGPSGPIHQFLEARGPGVQHIAFAVQEMSAAAKALEVLGVDLVRDAPFRDDDGNLSHFFAPKEIPGLLVELFQPAETEPSPFS